jgi:hypothetical protein
MLCNRQVGLFLHRLDNRKDQRLHQLGYPHPEAPIPELTASPVALIPAGVRRFLANREFAARDGNKNDAGRIRVNEDGVCYGFAPYLRRRGADADDLLILKFDIGSGVTEQQLSDDELVETLDSVIA